MFSHNGHPSSHPQPSIFNINLIDRRRIPHDPISPTCSRHPLPLSALDHHPSSGHWSEWSPCFRILVLDRAVLSEQWMVCPLYYCCCADVSTGQSLTAALRYPYPLFAMLDTTQRIALFCASALLMTVVTAVLKWLYGIINGQAPPVQRSGSVRSS
jgi:FAR-17a/AIG1-like protein